MKNKLFTPFRIGIHLATVPALVSGLSVFLILFMRFGLALLPLAYGVLTTLLVFSLVYLTSVHFLKKRIETLQSIIRKTSKHRRNRILGEHPDIADEMDLIIRESEETQKSTHREFKRMDATENYRKEFIGDISHELKTPIFSIQGYLETLQSGALEDPKVNYRFLSKAMDNVNRLVYLTEDLMEISKLETGELKPELEVIPLNNLVRDVIESLQYIAGQRRITLHFEQKETNVFVHADRHQIRQVLINLVENGIKYNKENGHVYVTVSFSTKYSDKVLVSVRDTGIGLEKENIDRVTERFFRVDKSRSREQGGTGLGLSIVKHILESHKEKLIIKSTVGKGSEFIFTLKRY